MGPGLDQGYRTENNGFNSGMVSRDKWLPPTVDQLRIATNPKVSYSLDGHTGPASSHIKNRGIQASVEKNKPDTFLKWEVNQDFLQLLVLKKDKPIDQWLQYIVIKKKIHRLHMKV